MATKREFRSRAAMLYGLEMTLRERWLDTYRHSMRLLIATKAPYRAPLNRQRLVLCSIADGLFNPRSKNVRP